MTTLIPMTRMIDAALGNTLDNWRELDSSSARTPRADILEGEKEFRIVMDMPGVRTEDLTISLENQTLSVKAEREIELPEEFRVRRRERSGKTSFQRTFRLANVVDEEHIQARLEGGVLQIALPKSEQTLPRRIEVK